MRAGSGILEDDAALACVFVGCGTCFASCFLSGRTVSADRFSVRPVSGLNLGRVSSGRRVVEDNCLVRCWSVVGLVVL